MLAHEKFDVFNAILSRLDANSNLTYSPLIREAFLFCLKNAKPKPQHEESVTFSFSGAQAHCYPEKRDIKKVGYFHDDDFLANILNSFVGHGVETVKLKLHQPELKEVLSNKQKEEIEFFESSLVNNFGTSLKQDFTTRFHLLNGMITKYHDELARSGVDAILLRVYYGLNYFPIIFACKMLGITVIDIQHGINGFKHLAYSKFKKSEINSPLLPDVFWTWSGMGTKMLIKDSEISSTANIIEGGNPVFTEENYSKKGSKILYTHQPQSKGIPVPYDEIKKVFTLKKEKVIIRPHPRHMKEAITIQSNLRKLGVKSKVEDSTKTSINESLCQASVHITHSSTCALDSLNFGIPSIYCSSYIGDVEREFATGLLFKADEINMKNIKRTPEKAIDYSIGSEKKINHGVTEILSLASTAEGK